MKVEKENIYKILISSLIISQIFGLYGGALVPARILVIVFLPFCFDRQILNTVKSNKSFLFIFYLVFIINGFLLFFLNPHYVNINSFIYLNINLLLVIELYLFSLKIVNIYSLVWKSWLILIFLTLPIAYIEILLDKHLSVSFFESNQIVGSLGIQKQFASVTFGNYNQYVFILCCAFPIIISRFLEKNSLNFYTRIISIFTLISIFLITIINGSRGGILALSISFIIFLYFKYKEGYRRKNVNLKFLFFLFILFIGLTYFVKNTEILNYLIFRITVAGYEDNSRMLLSEAGITMLINSYFLGVGPGNYMNVLTNYNLPVRDLPPHNMFIELVSQYGLIIFVFFLILLFKIYRNVFSTHNILVKYLLIATLFTMPVIYIINSVYIELIFMWMFIGSLFIIASAYDKLYR